MMLIIASRTPLQNTKAQYSLQIGKTNNQVEVMNYLKVDSGMVAPSLPILSPFYGPMGQMYFNKFGDSVMYYHNGIKWVPFLSSITGFSRSQVDSDILSRLYITAPSANALTNKSGAVSMWTNDVGYLTGITSSQVTSALGYTPYNSTNPAGYINSAAISGKVNYSDSLTTFSTPKNVKDSAISVRSAIPTNNNQLTNGSGYLTSASISGKVNYSDSLTTFSTPNNVKDSANSVRSAIRTNTNQLTNGAGFITGITSSNVTTALGYTPATNARTITVAGTTFDLSADRTFSPTTSNISEGSNFYYTDVRARAAISLTTTGSGVATYSGGTLNIPTPTNYVPTIHTVTRTVNSATYTPSTTLQASLNYTVQISCTASIGSASSGSVVLQFSTNGGGLWTTIGTITNSNTVTLAIVLNLVNTQVGTVVAMIPANALCRLVPTTSGTTTITYISGQEVY